MIFGKLQSCDQLTSPQAIITKFEHEVEARAWPAADRGGAPNMSESEATMRKYIEQLEAQLQVRVCGHGVTAPASGARRLA